MYWYFQDMIIDLNKSIQYQNKEQLKINSTKLKGALAGLIKGIYLWTIFIPIKTLCQK